MKKQFFLFIIAGLLSLCVTRGTCAQPFSDNLPEGKLIKLVAAIPFTGVPWEDVAAVNEKINEITEKEIGVTVEFPALSTSSSGYNYYDKATRLLSTSRQLDLMLGGYGSFMEAYVDKKLYPLDDLLLKYGQDIIEQVGEDKIHCCDIYDVLYGIPVNGVYTRQGNCYSMRRDILDKYHIDPEKIQTMDDLEHVFEIVKSGEPDMTVLAAGADGILSSQYYLNTSCGIPLTANMNYGTDEEMVCIFESEEYKEALKRVRRWHVKGYTNEDIFGETKPLSVRVKEGKIFAYTGSRSWDKGNDIFTVNGIEMVRISLDKHVVNYNGYGSRPYVITRNSISPEASMKLLNLFYSNQEIADLLCYGIEGVHYEKTEDGHFTYAKGRTDNPFLNNRGNMPNQFIAHVWEGEELDYWQQIAEQNETAVQSERSGFNFDYSKVEAEHREVVNIYNLYKKILNNGLDNQEECRERMLKEMEESGLRLLLKEEQTQYEAWKRRKL